MTKNIIVIGRGIIGASVAFSLQSAGAQVTIVADRSERATDGSFGWINASFYNDDAHHSLRNEGLAAYKRLSQALDIPVNWNGCLCWEN
ncbi:MAG: FAD-dependent oxidoreductase, partial [Paracoccaceae bacterium]|nr:FAD-dependent oxidoreductase [Paracoccaceae bacterium]